MSLELVTAGLKEKVGEDCGLGAVLKFDFGDDGILVLDASQVPNVVSNDDAEAACKRLQASFDGEVRAGPRQDARGLSTEGCMDNEQEEEAEKEQEEEEKEEKAHTHTHTHTHTV